MCISKHQEIEMKNRTSQISLFLVLLPLLIGLPAWHGLFAQAVKKDGTVSFKWAFGALTGAAKERKFVPVTRDTILSSGDEIKLAFEFTKPCFVYLVHQSPDGEISMLFPYDSKQYDTNYEVGKSYYVPKGQSWFELDETVGKETFHLLASSFRLMKLENLLRDYLNSPQENKATLARDVISEIITLRRQERLMATAAERPSTIGGGVRSTDKSGKARPDVTRIAIEVATASFYSKSITIDHR